MKQVVEPRRHRRLNRLVAWFGAAVLLAASNASPVARAEGLDEVGVWYDDTGKGAVELRACGDGLCGFVYWLRDPNNAEGAPLRDRYNPDESLQRRPICGLQVIGDLTVRPDGSWDGGWIYDPKTGKTYKVEIRRQGPDALAVRGYVSVKLLGRSLTWTRAPKDLPACNLNEAAATR